MKKTLIGTGALSWNRAERITDRYGAVTLNTHNSLDEKITNTAQLIGEAIKPLIGKRGKLVCEVLEVRESSHIGDLSNGFHTIMPKVGAEIVLGEGSLFQEQEPEYHAVGLQPTEFKEDDRFWLNPKALYTAHEQTVNLYFVEE